MTDPTGRDLSVVPTKELGVEFGTRPAMPPLEGVSDAQRRAGLQLTHIHQMHLRDMTQIRAFLQQLRAGKVTAKEFAVQVGAAQLTKNMRLFGTLCGRECQVLNFHHDAEEHMIFPELKRQNIPALSAVVERLKQEHLIVHELLDRLEGAAQNLVHETSPQNLTMAEEIFEQLYAVVVSHFGYEESELQEALGKYVPVI